MRTPTNYYLLNLALSDLMILICNLPLEILEIHFKEWIFSKLFCKLRNISAEFFTCSSILTILAFSCERYFAIMHPMKFHQLSHFRRAIHIIVIIWFISLAVSLPVGLSFDVVDIKMIFNKATNSTRNSFNNNYTNIQPLICKSCVTPGEYKKIFQYIVIAASFGFFYIPMLIIGTIYLLIGRELRRANKQESIQQQQQTFVLRKSTSSINNNNNNTQNEKNNGSSPTNKDINTPSHKSSITSTYSGGNVNTHPMVKLSARRHARKVIFKMLVAVVIAFFVCYAPFYFQRLVTSIGNHNATSSFHRTSLTILFITSGLTFYLGSIINPFLYNVVSNKYRQAFLNLFFCHSKNRTNFDQLNGIGGIIARKRKDDSLKLQKRNGSRSKKLLHPPFEQYPQQQQQQSLNRNLPSEQNKKKSMNLHFVFQQATHLASASSPKKQPFNTSSSSSSLYSYRSYRMALKTNDVNKSLPVSKRTILNSKFDTPKLSKKSNPVEI
ncbi:unnamed protein product [Didymodactylos carnosus]|nr:unnamed protein product [Didymodactylos carnosus]CAF4414908.1 unnamed protein product [Didymodactylos carnosus]